MIIKIWTDGSVNRKKDNICSWAFLVKINGQFVYETYDELKEDKNVRSGNRAEMSGIMEALVWLDNMITESGLKHNDYDVVIYSDSQYCVKGINEWIHGWRLKNYQGKKNVDMWKEFYKLVYPNPYKSLSIQWIRGHSGVSENERVDELCKKVTVK